MVEQLQTAGVLLGSSWTSGVNLYLTVAGLGIAQRLGWISLPGEMDVIANPLIIITASALYVIEFVADKIPYVDSAWDSVHTFIRPIGGGALGYAALAPLGPEAQIIAGLISGSIAAESHLTKATARVAINGSPEPVTNSVASVTEDGIVIATMWLIIKHPIIAAVAAIGLIIFSVWFLKVMYRFLKKLFSFLGGKNKPAPETTEKVTT